MEGLLRFYASTNGFYQGATSVAARGTSCICRDFFHVFPEGGGSGGKRSLFVTEIVIMCSDPKELEYVVSGLGS